MKPVCDWRYINHISLVENDCEKKNEWIQLMPNTGDEHCGCRLMKVFQKSNRFLISWSTATELLWHMDWSAIVTISGRWSRWRSDGVQDKVGTPREGGISAHTQKSMYAKSNVEGLSRKLRHSFRNVWKTRNPPLDLPLNWKVISGH